MAVFLGIGFQWLFGLLLAPVLGGAIKLVKARLQHRQGPPLLQPWYDLLKLFRKRMVLSGTTSWLFRVPPFLEIGVALGLLLVVPGPFRAGAAFPFGADLVALLYLMALARFFSALAGLDAGSAFGGMGSSREMTLAALIEPGLVLILFLLGFKAGSLSLNPLFHWAAQDPGWILSPLHLLTGVAYFMLMIAETGRIPVDNPDTHLELTMIHEGMILEYSGPFLALINWAAWIRQYLFFSIFIQLFWPVPAYGGFPGPFLSLADFCLKLALVGGLVALVESLLAKMRLLKAPRLLWAAFAFGVLGLLTAIF
jgi:formate hydrogenlyase subunit 4